MISRRLFIKQTGLLSAGIALSPSFLYGQEVKKAGIQLYTLRNEIVKDVKGVIKQVSASGYNLVETYGYTKTGGYWGLDAKTFNTLLKDNGLATPSGHYGMDEFLLSTKMDDLKWFIEAANITGQEFVTMPVLPEALRKSSDSFKLVAEKLNKAGELCKQSGVKMAYHNHDFEFKDLGGEIGYDILLKNTDPSLVKLELDLYWVIRAGHDVSAIFKKNPGRFAMWHVKDMDKADPKLNTEVGNGSINFNSLFANQKTAGVKYIFMEQENNYKPDIYASIKQSAGYIKTKLL